MLYVPNIGELTALKAIFGSMALRVGLYKNVVTPDGNTTFLTMQEKTQGGGRGYATKDLPNVVNETGLATNQWFLGPDSSGKEAAQYADAGGPSAPYLEWTFNDTDVGDAATIYGVFGWTLIVPFNNGSAIINPGDTVTGGTSAATGVVTAVWVSSGTWGGGNAAGWLAIKSQTGAFQNGEALKVGGSQKAVSNTGTAFAGDSLKILMFVEAFSDPKPITLSGQKLRYTLTPTMSTG